jgi:signal transduction histidine kinase/ActR/RegA family two-component response regulator
MSAHSKGIRQRSFRLRIVGPAALVAVPLMAVAGWRAYERQDAEMRALESEAREQVAVAVAELDGQLASVRALLAGVARLTDPGATPEQTEALLRDVMRAGPLRVANVWLADGSGRLVAAAQQPRGGIPELSATLGPLAANAAQNRRVTFGDAIRAPEVPEAPWALTVAVPMDGPGPTLRGVLGATVVADSLDAMAIMRRLPPGSVLTLQDSMGGIVWRSLNPDAWVGRQFGITEGFRTVRMLGRGVDVTRSADSTVRQVAFRTMPSTGWVVYVGIPDALTRQVVQSQLLWDLVYVVLATLGLLGVAWFAADRVAVPIVADALAREAAERALAESREQLRQAQKMDALGSFAGGIAHDFNNYLSSIIGFSEMALADLPPGHVAGEEMRHVLATAERAAKLTRQILVFSRRTPVEPQAIDVAAVMRDLVPLLVPLVGERVQLDVTAAPDTGLIRADRSQLEQVMVNLAANARDAMPEGGALTLRAARTTVHDSADAAVPPGEYVTLTVQDSGVGMPDEIRERIFEPFFTTKEPGRGTGLGLALVYSMVQQARGVIRVTSAPGTGTTVTLQFRRLATAEVTAAVTPVTIAAVRGAGERILVTEDDPSVRQMTVQQLTRAGYRVIEATNGEEALAVLGDGREVDLLLTDVVMPGLHGRAFLERVEAVAPGLPVLVMSAHPDDDTLVQDMRQASVPFLAKPFSREALLVQVRQVLSLTQARPL